MAYYSPFDDSGKRYWVMDKKGVVTGPCKEYDYALHIVRSLMRDAPWKEYWIETTYPSGRCR